MEILHQIHEFQPVYNHNSTILILGTFPSVKSREQKFYYGHPQNRFWKLLAALLQCEIPQTVDEKRAMLLQHGIAVWDVIQSCDIKGSSDSSIKNVIPNDISGLLEKTNISSIYANGAKSAALYDKYLLDKTNIPIVCLPSTSPANASYTIDRLMEKWTIILEKTGSFHD